MTIRVLIQPMHYFERRVGGGKVELLNKVERLRAYDIQACISTDTTADLSSYDLVHIYFPLQVGLALQYFLNARRQAKPVVVSPVYWNLGRYFRETRRLFFGSHYFSNQSLQMRKTVELDFEREQEEVYLRLLEQQLVVRQADLLLPLSQMEADLLERDAGASKDRMRVIHNGVDPSVFWNADPEPFRTQIGERDFVLCAARLEENKNQISLIRALAHEAIPLVFIGRWGPLWYREECQRAANGRIQFIDRLPQSALAQAMAAAKVHAIVSWFDVAPLSSLEAGLAGCNLVLTTESSGREYYGDGAWYCDPSDLQSIRGAVLDAYAAPRRPELAAHIRNQYTWEKATAATARAYAEAVQQAGSSGPLMVQESIDTLIELVARWRGLVDTTASYNRQLWQMNEELHRQMVSLDQLLHQIEKGKVMRVLRAVKNPWK